MPDLSAARRFEAIRPGTAGARHSEPPSTLTAAVDVRASLRPSLGRFVRSIPCVLLVLLVAAPAIAQSPPARTRWVQGTVGVRGEAYSVSGRAGRRPPLLGEAFAQLQLQGLGMQTGLNLSLSTDESSARQQISQLGLTGRWSWAEAGAGHVPYDWARYGLSGLTLLGGTVTLMPGQLMLGFGGGRAQVAASGLGGLGAGQSVPVPGALGGEAFERWVWAARFGLGKRENTHFHLVGVYGHDKAASLPNPGTLSPAENVALSPSFGLAFPIGAGRLRLALEGTASLYTRDTNAPALDVDLGPLQDLLTLRESSSATAAGNAVLELMWPTAGITGRYERIQPGFETMGLSYLRDDQEAFEVRPRLSLLGRRLDVEGGLRSQRNNLASSRSATLYRDEADVRLRLRIGQYLTLNTTARGSRNTSKPTLDNPNAVLLQQDNRALALQVTPMFVRASGPRMHTLALATTYQRLTDESPAVAQGLRPDIGSNTGAASLTYGLGFRSGPQVNVLLNAQTADGPALTSRTFGGTLGGSMAFLQNALRVNASGSANQTHTELTLPTGLRTNDNLVLTATLGGQYRLSAQDGLTLQLRGTRMSGSASFQEGTASLRYERRF
ncbi:MAG TPA: hypothetical protein VD948_08490 [Rhodothermales bacterium]|nr:hypothetical protein [Rhodothermales bacterium]